MIKHNYRYWHEMFFPRQLLALSTLLKGIMDEPDQILREMLLCAFSNTLEGTINLLGNSRKNDSEEVTPPAGIFSRHDYQPKVTPCEDNVWGSDIGKGFGAWFKISGGTNSGKTLSTIAKYLIKWPINKRNHKKFDGKSSESKRDLEN